MKRWAIALVLAAACGGKAKQDSTTTGAGEGSDTGPALYAKKVAISWGIQPGTGQADVFLQVTDETGKQTSYPLGTFPGACTVITPAPEMAALTGVACTSGGVGVELDAVVRDAEVIVLKVDTAQGVAPDPMARQEVLRVQAPPGAKIEAGT